MNDEPRAAESEAAPPAPPAAKPAAPLPHDARRLHIQLSEAQWYRLLAAAKAHGKSPTAYSKALVIGKLPAAAAEGGTDAPGP